MHRKRLMLTPVLMTAVGLALLGCTSSTPSPSASPTAESHGNHDHDGEIGASDMDKMMAELAKLPEVDRLAAEKQHMCPVSGEMLGTMGAPLKVQVREQDVWLCCEGCKGKLLQNADEYLGKLSK